MSAQQPWRDPALPADKRVEVLLDAMTTAEKIAQLGSRWIGNQPTPASPPAAPTPTPPAPTPASAPPAPTSAPLAPAPAGSDPAPVAPMEDAFAGGQVSLEEASRYGLGQLTRVWGSRPLGTTEGAAELARQHRVVLAGSRLGIPAIVHEECLTGFTTYGATVYPTPLAWAATFDSELVERMATAIGRDLAAAGVHQGLAPVLDVVRDYRWGRVEETFGEDPYLVGQLGSAYVRGLQSAGVIATLKHFAGYAASRAARNHGPVSIGRRELLDIILPVFETAIRTAGARSVMCAYNDLDGVPATADTWLLTSVLRDEWEFDGTVVSDYWSVPFLATMHGIAATPDEAGALALLAGTDVELPDTVGFANLLERAESGELPMEVIDRATRRVLLQKTELGLLDPGWSPEARPRDLNSPENQALATELAERSIVLLDAGSALPLVRPGEAPLAHPAAAPNAGREAGAGAAAGSGAGLGVGSEPGASTAAAPGAGPGAGAGSEAGAAAGGGSEAGAAAGAGFEAGVGAGAGFEAGAGAALEAGAGAGAGPGVGPGAGAGVGAGLGPGSGGEPVGWGRVVPGRIAVVGPCAADPLTLLGCYAFPNHVLPRYPDLPLGVEIPSVLDALRAELPEAEISYQPGCEIRTSDRTGFAAAEEAARAAEVCIAFIGDRSGLFGHGTTGEGCDAEDLRLPGVQAELVERLIATGTPVVVVVVSGRPYALGEIAERAAGLVQAFLPGQAGGAAIAGVLSGRITPGGKLPVQIPRGPGGQPGTYLQPPLGTSASAGISSLETDPLFPFGYGSSYTRFTVGELRLSRTEVPTDGEFTATVRVTNTGDRAGDEVVQLYLHDVVAQVARPVWQLTGFARVTLQPGESVDVTFEVHADRTAYTGRELRRIVEPGEIEVAVGTSVRDLPCRATVRLTGAVRAVGPDRTMITPSRLSNRAGGRS